MNERVLVGMVMAMVVGGCSGVFTQQLAQEKPPAKVLLVRQTEDFIISGRGNSSAWGKATWEPLYL
ncbi:MAG: hypothetical protein WBC22_08380, partial [Sedimentisphaerales bacterium]